MKQLSDLIGHLSPNSFALKKGMNIKERAQQAKKKIAFSVIEVRRFISDHLDKIVNYLTCRPKPFGFYERTKLAIDPNINYSKMDSSPKYSKCMAL